MKRSMRQMLWVVTIVAVVGAAEVAGAFATPPGRNGKIVFRRYFNQDHSWGVLFTVNPDESGIRQITHPGKGVLDNEPDWSPNGRQVAFQRVDPNGCGKGCETDEINLVNGNGTKLTRLAYDAKGKGCARNDKNAGGICRGDAAWS